MVAQCCQEWWLSVAPGTESVPRTLNTRASTSLSPPPFTIRRIRLGPLTTGVGCCRILYGGSILIIIKVHTGILRLQLPPEGPLCCMASFALCLSSLNWLLTVSWTCCDIFSVDCWSVSQDVWDSPLCSFVIVAHDLALMQIASHIKHSAHLHLSVYNGDHFICEEILKLASFKVVGWDIYNSNNYWVAYLIGVQQLQPLCTNGFDIIHIVITHVSLSRLTTAYVAIIIVTFLFYVVWVMSNRFRGSAL